MSTQVILITGGLTGIGRAAAVASTVCAAHFAVPGRMTSMTLDFAGTPDARLKE
jgi:NAD(P)-dependent dehydrogenase (short-subunit alcohol dehydrogenase family)